MQFNGFADELQYFATRFAYGNAARQIRDVSPIAALSLLYNDKIFH